MADKIYRLQTEWGEIEYRVDRGKRKHSYICISKGEVTVKIPARMSLKEAERILLDKSGWVINKLQGQAAQKRGSLEDGCTVYLSGLPYELKVIPCKDKSAKVTLNYGILLAELPKQCVESKNALQPALEDFYRKFTQRMVDDSLLRLTEQTGLCPTLVTIKKLTASWGRCDSKGKISISLYLGAYPQSIVDYVVLHELCHLRQMNHSAAFWEEMCRFMPDCKQRRAALKRNLTIKP